ncbi:MAG: sulfur carrier protein ThiS [Bacteroidota bacterium]|nr:sulfur carrier protein ThiS [Bacteroidota bacterium]
MEILLNNQSKEIQEQCSLQQMLNDTLGEKQKGIAVAVNNNVVPKASWHHHILTSKDSVLVIKATQGG